MEEETTSNCRGQISLFWRGDIWIVLEGWGGSGYVESSREKNIQKRRAQQERWHNDKKVWGVLSDWSMGVRKEIEENKVGQTG